jgi:hypothetical protein
MRIHLKNFILVALISVATSAAHAQSLVDYSLGGGARGRPLGAAIYLDAGLNFLVWGEDGPGRIEYGYIRPYGRVQTSGVVNKVEVGTQVWPISFVNIQAFQSFTDRGRDKIDTLDCGARECAGRLSRTGVLSQIFLGVGPLFAVPSFRWEWLAPQNSAAPFGDESSNLFGQRGGDRLVTFSTAAGIKLDPVYSTGVILDFQNMKTSGANNAAAQLFVRRSDDPWTLALSAGTYRSTTAPLGWTGGFVIQWTGAPSLAIR